MSTYLLFVILRWCIYRIFYFVIRVFCTDNYNVMNWEICISWVVLSILSCRPEVQWIIYMMMQSKVSELLDLHWVKVQSQAIRSVNPFHNFFLGTTWTIKDKITKNHHTRGRKSVIQFYIENKYPIKLVK